MEQIKSCFEHDYNLAVKSFNEKDYVSFFRNIRPAIEWLGKLVIYNTLRESDAIKLVHGDISIEWNRETRTYQIMNSQAHHKPTGREFSELALKAFYTQHPDILTMKSDENKKRLKRALDSCTSSLTYYYSIASEFGSHTGDSNMDIKIHAISCASFLNALFDFWKNNGVLSASVISFIDSCSHFTYDTPSAVENAKQQIFDLENQINEKDTALRSVQKKQEESEKKRIEAEQQTAEIETRLNTLQKRMVELQKKITQGESGHNQETLQHTSSKTQEEKNLTPTKLNDLMKKDFSGIAEGIDVDEDSMDDDQLDLIDYTNDKSMLVAGCAGSGKSVIAMHKAEQLYLLGKDVILIAYTKSLSGFMKVGNPNASYRFYYYYQWEKLNKPQADYVIVDEIQDFTREEIQEFIHAAKKHFLFFGDSAQSIYQQYGKQTMSIAQIAQMTGLNTLQLFNNYRLPRPVAKITQNYVGVDVQEYKEKVYQNKETELPHFVYMASETEEINNIKQIINSHPNQSIGILCPSNEIVLQLNQNMLEQRVCCEFKYNDTDDEKNNSNTLNFSTLIPKILTYHSAKGLQFDIVILPRYNGANSIEAKKSLYVAMTRTKHKLYVLYTTSELSSPLKEVPSHLYVKEI